MGFGGVVTIDGRHTGLTGGLVYLYEYHWCVCCDTKKQFYGDTPLKQEGKSTSVIQTLIQYPQMDIVVKLKESR